MCGKWPFQCRVAGVVAAATKAACCYACCLRCKGCSPFGDHDGKGHSRESKKKGGLNAVAPVVGTGAAPFLVPANGKEAVVVAKSAIKKRRGEGEGSWRERRRREAMGNQYSSTPVVRFKLDDGDATDDVDGATMGSALGTALAIVDAGGSPGGPSADPAPVAEESSPAPAGGEAEPTHPCVPEGSEGDEVAKVDADKEEVEKAKGSDGEGGGGGGKGKKGEKEASNEILKEVGKAEGEKDGGVEGVDEKKDEGREKVEEEEEEGKKVVVEAAGVGEKKEGEVVEVEGRVEGAGSGEGSKGAAVVVPEVQRQEEEQVEAPKADQSEEVLRSSPPRRESNCGGAALPIDLSVGLLGADIDEQLREAREKGLSFTTLPLEIPNSPPPRPKHLSCSYPSGALHLTPEELQEDPMSATFVVPPLNHKGGDASTPGSTIPSAPYGSKYPGQTRNGKISQQVPREGRRSFPNRNGVISKSSVSSAPAVHPSRSSSTSTALFPESLPPVKNPKDALRQSFQNMDDPDWEVAMKGLELLVRLIRHHPSYVQSELTRVIATLARQIRNLRSQVARAACQASGELALPRVAPASPTSLASDSSVSSTSLLRRALEADLEEVAAPLLHRSADTNRFLRDDCVAALDRFVAGVGPSRVVGPILSKGVTHQNALVRTVTARLLATIVAKLGAERVMTQLNKDVRAKVLRSGANLLMEGSLQTRTYAKQVFRCLAAHESFERALTQSVPTTVLRNIHKTLLSIKKESLGTAGADPSWEA